MSIKKLTKTLSLVCVSAVTLATSLGCGMKVDVAAVPADVGQILMPVKAAVAVTRDVTQALNFSGSIDAFRRTAIAPAVMGSRVLSINVEEGQAVRENQLLAKMEDFQLRQSEAQLGQLEADYNRMAALYSRGSATQQQYEQVRTSYVAARAQYEMLQNSVELRAPFSGTIIGRHINEGEVYTGSPGIGGVSGVLSVAQLGRMKIEVMAPEQDFVHLRPGQIARVRVDAFPDTIFEGKVFTVNPSLNGSSRTSRVAIEIMNERQLLKPGMFARVEIITDTRENVLAVPATAIVMRDGEPHVFTVENNTAPFITTPTLVRVKTGVITDRYAQILEGIDENTVVLTDNNTSLLNDTGIRVTSVER